MKSFFIGLALSATMMGGCLKATFTTNAPAVGSVQNKKVTFLVYGLLNQPQVIDVNQLCPGGNVSMIRTGLTAGNALLQGFTGGIIARRTVWYSCGSAPSAQQGSQPNQQAEILLDANGEPEALVLTNEDGTTQVGQVSRGAHENQFVATFNE